MTRHMSTHFSLGARMLRFYRRHGRYSSSIFKVSRARLDSFAADSRCAVRADGKALILILHIRGRLLVFAFSLIYYSLASIQKAGFSRDFSSLPKHVPHQAKALINFRLGIISSPPTDTRTMKLIISVRHAARAAP